MPDEQGHAAEEPSPGSRTGEQQTEAPADELTVAQIVQKLREANAGIPDEGLIALPHRRRRPR